MGSPLEGIRVIDWTIFQQGPLASMMFADLGAEVIHVEHRITGDAGRGVMKMLGQTFGIDTSRNYYFEANNRGKKSITLDPQKERAREVIYRLVKKSDVFMQNFRKGVAERRGLDYPTLAAHNPKLIYATAGGYGPRGPESGRASLDILAEARAGTMFLAGEPDAPPEYVVGGIADQMGAIMLAYGVLAALVARDRQGVGQEVDASHLGSMIWLQGLAVSAKLTLGGEQPRWCRRTAKNPIWNYYQCADGRWICLGMAQSDRFWADFCKAAGITHLKANPRYANADSREKNCEELVSILDRLFSTKPRDEWLAILDEASGGLVAPVNTISDLENDPQVIANEYIVEFDHPSYGKLKVPGIPVKFGATPGSIVGPAPEFGQHTEEVLMEVCGYNWNEIEELKSQEVV